MLTRTAINTLCAATLIVCSGCTTIGLDKKISNIGSADGRMSNAGANQLTGMDKNLKLPQILGASSENNTGSEPTVDEGLKAFYKDSSTSWEVRRDRIQDRLLAASEERCNTYKIYLKNIDSETKSIFGVATVILAGAGAIATGPVNSRALAGLAGITSGAGAEMTSAVFSNVATHVLIPGIDARRDEIRKDIETKRTRMGEQYTMEAALLDAARYHGACTLDTGLRAASDSVNEVQNVGVKRLNDVLALASQTKFNLDAAARGEPVTRVSGSTVSLSNHQTFMAEEDTTPIIKLQDSISKVIDEFSHLEQSLREIWNDYSANVNNLTVLNIEIGEKKTQLAEFNTQKSKLPDTPESDAEKKAIDNEIKKISSEIDQKEKIKKEQSAQEVVVRAKRKALIDAELAADSGVIPKNPIVNAREALVKELLEKTNQYATLSSEIEQAKQDARSIPSSQKRTLHIEQARINYDVERVKLRRMELDIKMQLQTALEQLSADRFSEFKLTLERLAAIKYSK